MKKKYIYFIVLAIFIILMVGCCSSNNQMNLNQSQVKDLKYTVEFNDNRYMSFYINNLSNTDVLVENPSTHTFNFRLFKDGKVVWDSYKDDKTIGKENWKTLFTVKANDKFEQMVWYANIDKDLSGEYEYEFYFTGSNLESVPHLTGKLELVKGKFDVDRIRIIK